MPLSRRGLLTATAASALAAALPVRAAAPGRIERLPDIAGDLVSARHVDVWLPPEYDADAGRRYPVLYMHDGQNVFEPGRTYGWQEWNADETMTRLIGEGAVRSAIIVGVWSNDDRTIDYTPQKPITTPTFGWGIGDEVEQTATLNSDNYLRYLVEQLKPAIDARYRTLTGRADTVIMGSSLGGLISAYAVAEYPEVFGGAGCLSIHWPAADGAILDWFGAHLPDPATHRLYFDHGTKMVDEMYAPFQARADVLGAAGGYVADSNWMSRGFEGAEHTETAWSQRLHIPLTFLLGT